MRRSERAIRPAPLREIVNALGFAMQPRFVLEGDTHLRTRRPTISAGALHSVNVVVVDWRCFSKALRYDPMTHRLQSLRVVQSESLHEFAKICGAILPEGPKTALALIGDKRRIDALYEHSTSLLWRDAGALLQTLAIVSAAYRLAFCPLGTLGGHLVEALGLNQQFARPVGCAAIGRLPVEFEEPR